MKLLLIRHGDPDYVADSLTEKGWREAEFLAERISALPLAAIYVSPLGRAQDTASLTLKKMNHTAVTCPWLREFAPHIDRPDKQDSPVCWDWLPADWAKEERYYSADGWYTTDVMRAGHVEEEYRWVTDGFDRLLETHGYVREGHLYRAVRANQDTLAFFCHFGVTAVLLSHLLGISPMPIWQGMCAAPTSVTTVVTEERREGIASFRMSAFGDTAHLYVKEEPPSFSARFCECYANDWERHD